MSFYKPLFSSLVAVLFVLSQAAASTIPETVKAKPAETNVARGGGGDGGGAVNNFPVNGLPPLTYSTKTYTFNNTGSTFFQAWYNCRSMGQRLASIENFQDLQAYRDQISPFETYDTAYWIAATNLGARHDERGNFYWITNDRPVGYLNGFQNWIDGVIPNDKDVCVSTYLPSAMWVYGSCDSVISYACEISQDV